MAPPKEIASRSAQTFIIVHSINSHAAKTARRNWCTRRLWSLSLPPTHRALAAHHSVGVRSSKRSLFRSTERCCSPNFAALSTFPFAFRLRVAVFSIEISLRARVTGPERLHNAIRDWPLYGLSSGSSTCHTLADKKRRSMNGSELKCKFNGMTQIRGRWMPNRIRFCASAQSCAICL